MSESIDNLSNCSHATTENGSLDQIPTSWALDIEDLGNPLETAVGGTHQQALAPSPTFTPIPSDDSDTSWDCVEAASSHPLSHSVPLKFQPKRSPQPKAKNLRQLSRAKYMASLPKLGGLPPPIFRPTDRAPVTVDTARTGLPPPPPKARPKSLQQALSFMEVSSPAKPQLMAPTIQAVQTFTSAGAPPKLHAKNDFQSQKSIAATAMSQVQARWLRIIKSIPEASYLAQTAAETSHEDDLLRASLRGYQASSLQTYIRQIENFLTYLAKSQLSLESLTLPQFLDYLWACQDSQQEDRQAFKCKPQAALKALSWFHKKGQIASLSHLCLNPLVQAFSKEDGPSDRREAMPLPLAVLVAWETKIREPTCPPALALLLGGFLRASHCSLRFGDLQRICVSSLTISSNALRGCCWRTKTSNTGQPFASSHLGLSGRDTASAWTIAWLSHLQASVLNTRQALGVTIEPDFLIPQASTWDNPETCSLQSPLQYHQALTMLRWAVQTPWQSALVSPAEAQAFTLHSLKVCLLSASAQLRLPEEARRLQGHHKLTSVQLYSRDDTIQSLWLQRQVALRVKAGWRPPRPQARGSQPHTIEPAFSVSEKPLAEAIILSFLPPSVSSFLYQREVYQQEEIRNIHANIQIQVDEEALLVEGFAHMSSSDSDAQPAETESATGTDLPSLPGEEVTAPSSLAVQLFPWGCIHAALQPSDGSTPSRTACGRTIPKGRSYPEDLLQAAFCRRSGCKQAFVSHNKG